MAKKKGGKKKGKTSSKKKGGSSSSKKKGKSSKPKKQAESVVEEVIEQPVEEPVEDVTEEMQIDEPEEEIIEDIPEPEEEVIEEEVQIDEDVPEPENEDIADDMSIDEDISEPVEDDSKLSDAVSAVISDEDSGEKKEVKKKKTATEKKREKMIMQWAAEGYNVETLESLLESGVRKGVKKVFDQFDINVKRIEEIKEELGSAGLEDVEAKVEEFNTLLSNPNDLDNIELEFTKLKSSKRVAEIKKELDGMVLDSLKDRVAELHEMLENPDNLPEVEEKLAELKKDYKEAYFEDGVESLVTTTDEDAKPKAVAKKPAQNGAKKKPMEVKDIFLLYKDGKFISHHTARVVPKEEQEQLFADLKTGRNYLKSPNYKPQKLNVISVNGRKILVQGGQYTVIIMVVTGDVNPWTEKIVKKVQGLLEKEDVQPLTKWNGDVASLKSAGKYMTALLYACMKLSNKK